MLSDKKLSTKLKKKMCKTAIRPVLMYSLETMALRKAEERVLEKTNVKMLRWIGGINLRQKKRNEDAGYANLWVLKKKSQKNTEKLYRLGWL